MPRCRNCGHEHDAADLVRHEREALVRIHCPDCKALLGEYNSRVR